jgi:hypothetical protein
VYAKKRAQRVQVNMSQKATTIAYQIYGAFSAVLLLVVVPMSATTLGLTVAYLLTGLAGYLIICNHCSLRLAGYGPRLKEPRQPPQV